MDWATEDGTATTAGSDYTAGSDTLTFALGGARTKQFTVATTHDTRDENDEDFTVTLSGASGASARIGTDTATATIRDNDVPVMSIGNATANENDGRITFDVSLSPASDLAITATYATGNGTAAAGTDFTAPAAGSMVRFSPGTTSAQIAIALIDDTANESTETFTVTLSGPSSSAILGTARATGTIEDDDVSFTFAIAGGGTVAEGGSATFTVTVTPLPATATPGEELTVDWATEDGSAVAGSDYTLGTGTLTFAMGASGNALTRQLTVATLVDKLDELEEEQFSVGLRNETGAGARIGGKATAKATITDNDEPVLSIDDADRAGRRRQHRIPRGARVCRPPWRSPPPTRPPPAPRRPARTSPRPRRRARCGSRSARRPPRSPSTCSTTTPTSRTRPSPSP